MILKIKFPKKFYANVVQVACLSGDAREIEIWGQRFSWYTTYSLFYTWLPHLDILSINASLVNFPLSDRHKIIAFLFLCELIIQKQSLCCFPEQTWKRSEKVAIILFSETLQLWLNSPPCCCISGLALWLFFVQKILQICVYRLKNWYWRYVVCVAYVPLVQEAHVITHLHQNTLM